MRETPSPQTLRAFLNGHGIAVSPEQAEMLFEHVRLMLEWNLRSNLTRITEFDRILTAHLLDSLLPARWLPLTGKTLDVGTGAGFPGVPLKILHSKTQMYLLESNRKKVSFLKVLLAGLSLPGIHVLHGRWEEPGGWFSEGDERFTAVIMRAVRIEPGHLTRLAPRVLRPGGVFAWWAGSGRETALENRRMHAYPAPAETRSYELPGMSAPRRLYLWRMEG